MVNPKSMFGFGWIGPEGAEVETGGWIGPDSEAWAAAKAFGFGWIGPEADEAEKGG